MVNLKYENWSEWKLQKSAKKYQDSTGQEKIAKEMMPENPKIEVLKEINEEE